MEEVKNDRYAPEEDKGKVESYFIFDSLYFSCHY